MAQDPRIDGVIASLSEDGRSDEMIRWFLANQPSASVSDDVFYDWARRRDDELQARLWPSNRRDPEIAVAAGWATLALIATVLVLAVIAAVVLLT